ncbi:MAG: radical SAM protein [Methanomicrobiaceae archaeon]|nr:radical SAM protein [Methanomicrobiaceae archaeon]
MTDLPPGPGDRAVRGTGADAAVGPASGPPQLISWNITLRCPLKCPHCYVQAGENETVGVLSTDEALAVIDQIRDAGTPVVVLSGGEPLMREDLCTIARYGTERGLRMVMGTSGYFLDRSMAARLRDAGIRAVAVSIDAADPAVHDAVRGVSGAWQKAVQAVRNCRDEGMDVRINMTVMRPRAGDVHAVVELGQSLGVTDYQVFFPVPTGRAQDYGPLDPRDYEAVIRQVLLTYHGTGVNLRPTCAPQFRRIALDLGIDNPAWGRGCIAGTRYCRIYADGQVTPCPFLPVSAGNVRKTPFREIWYHSPVFSALRDPDLLTGKCGRCGYKGICGGCRARAYRGTGGVVPRWCDGLMQPGDRAGELCDEDPWCPYDPGGGP